MTVEIKAKILEILDTVQISASFRKREFIVEYADNPQYPECLKMEMVQKNCELLNDFSVGDEVKIYFDLKGRKWVNPKGENVYFNSIQAWKLMQASEDVASDAGMNQSQDAPPMNQDNPPWESYENDVPF